MCFIYVYFWNRKMDNPVPLSSQTFPSLSPTKASNIRKYYVHTVRFNPS